MTYNCILNHFNHYIPIILGDIMHCLSLFRSSSTRTSSLANSDFILGFLLLLYLYFLTEATEKMVNYNLGQFILCVFCLNISCTN